ncbi:MAG: hypothetical protein E6J34_12715 [Chloroflexi bacterium]|nr:MAG: hypothetical protein E6J34_12715 [Chloroflexota bacterium]
MQWPSFDIDILRNDQQASWFQRLSEVATTLVCQWILIIWQMKLPGPSMEANDGTLRSLLLYVPTPVIRGNEYRPFEIEDMSLDDWAGAFKSIDDDPNSAIPSLRMTQLWEIVDAMEGQVEDRPSLAENNVAQALQASQSVDRASSERLQTAIETFPSSPLLASAGGENATITKGPLNINLDFGSAPMYTPTLSPTELALVLGNTTTKVAIVLALAKEEIRAWDLMAAECAERVAQWTAETHALERQYTLLQQCHNTSFSFHQNTMEPLVNKADHLQTTIDAAKQNKSVARFLDRKIKWGTPTPISPIAPSSFHSAAASANKLPFPSPVNSSQPPNCEQHFRNPSPPVSGFQLQSIIDNARREPVMRSVINPTQFLQAPVSMKIKDDSPKEQDDEMKDVQEKDNDDEEFDDEEFDDEDDGMGGEEPE